MTAISTLVAPLPPYSSGRASRSQPAASARRRISRSSASHSAVGTPPASKFVRAYSRRWSKKRMLSSWASSGLISRSMNSSSWSSVACSSVEISKSMLRPFVRRPRDHHKFSAVPEELDYEERDGVGVITLQRPEARNALTRTTYAELEEAVRSTTARCLVVTGADPAFCSGDDVKQIMAGGGGSGPAGPPPPPPPTPAARPPPPTPLPPLPPADGG